MREYMLAVSIIGILVTALSPVALSQSSQESEISISVNRQCEATSYEFRFASGNVSQNGVPLVGTGGNGYFIYNVVNNGEMSYIEENIEIYEVNVSTAEVIRDMNVSSEIQPGTFNSSYTLNDTNLNADPEISRLRRPQDRAINLSYWYSANYSGWPDYPESTRTNEFIASSNYTAGFYRADLELDNTCEFEGNDETDVYNTTSDSSFALSDINSTLENGETLNLSVDGINASVIDPEDGYVQSVKFEEVQSTYFRVVALEGNGSTPNEISDINNEIGRNLETDADEVSNFTKNSSIDRDVDKNQNTSLDTNRNVTSNLTRNSSLDSDTEQTSDATEIEGNNPDQPGETPVPEPEPEPEPDPIPLLSVDMKPLNSTYTTPKGRFAEIGLNITNTGEETLNNLQLEPRFSEGMDWQAQDTTIGSLGVGETVNQSVYVNAGETVDAGIYQIPVYASNDENDIGNQYVNVEVTEEVFTSALNIGEAPQDIQFETGQNYSIPVLLENDGDSSLENVEIELQNTEGCGEYSSESLDQISPGESASINIDFEASSDLNECEATLVASTDSGEFAFSDMNIENVEDPGVVPQEFRFPIVASMWTLMLLAYAVLTKRYGMHNLTVKVPLVLLVVGEALILIYLSSVYYDVLPPGLLPFS